MNDNTFVQAPADPPVVHEAATAPREHALSRSAETSAVSSIPAAESLPEGVTRITRVEGPNGKAKGFIYTSAYPYGNGPGLAVYDERLADLATQCCQDGTPVKLTTKKSADSGKVYVKDITRVSPLSGGVASEMFMDDGDPSYDNYGVRPTKDDISF